MTSQEVKILRLSLGVTTAVAVSYGVSWPLAYITPLFSAMFLCLPKWIGWKQAAILICLLVVSLLVGLFISEVLLGMALVCIPVMGLLLFYIYYLSPLLPPVAAIFLTIGVVMVPITGLSSVLVSHVIVVALLFNMSLGLVFAWFFHGVVPDTLCKEQSAPDQPDKKPQKQVPSKEERAKTALVSTFVALTAVIMFFFLNLAQYALAMLFICIMAGTPNISTSFQIMKANATATLIGGIAIIVAYNVLVAVPTYLFLIVLVLLFSLFFARKIFSGGPYAAAFQSGFTTFLVLLGSSTGGEDAASADFYIRIAQILFAGLFTIVLLGVADRIIHSRARKQEIAFPEGA